MGRVRVAVVEAPRDPSPERNREIIVRVLERVGKAREGIVAFLPENWLSRDPLDEEDYTALLEEVYESTGTDFFAGLAYINLPDGVRSRGYAVINGRVELVCEKRFPSKAVGERGWIAEGRVSRVVWVGEAGIGCVACVDIFYPEVSRRLAVMGANVLYNPAAIPGDRLGLWWSVLQARAAENVAFTIGVNSIGVRYPDGRITGGGSRVYSPDGSLVPAEPIGGALVYELDLDELERVMERWAFREDLESKLKNLYLP